MGVVYTMSVPMTSDDHQSTQPAGPVTPAQVVADPGILGGWPCFAGTRVPASMVVAMVNDGTPWSQLVSSYPFLTEAHLAAARAYLASPENQGKGPTNWLGLPAQGHRRVLRPGKTTPVARDEL